MEDEMIILDFISKIHYNYKKIVDDSFSHNLEQNPDLFPFYKFDNCDVVVIVNDTKEFEEYGAYLCVYVKKGDEGVKNIYKVSALIDEIDVINFSNAPAFFNFCFDKVVQNVNPVLSFHLLNNFRTHSDIGYLYGSGLTRQIRDYRYSYHTKKGLSNSVLSKKEYSVRYSYSKFDLEPILDYFKSDKQQLSILFEQMMFCYEHNKFLASAACAGVAIEEVCVLILEELGFDGDIRHKNTTIVELGGILRSKGVIDRRISMRLNAAATIRNTVSHTSSGYSSAEDTDLLVATAKNLFNAFMDYKKRDN